ncbi:solute carrier organic anion transporter family member 1A4-like [Acanthaster planci]|uniref:Solute carrier organic anion transporter family member n=1 Tax=Acanthaster planci TaxID=133434 RepID=A0A8B7YGW9_ACAPL|nr:solute carrier organic anion transporter family member 1A4-like [Acanthaster planci]
MERGPHLNSEGQEFPREEQEEDDNLNEGNDVGTDLIAEPKARSAVPPSSDASSSGDSVDEDVPYTCCCLWTPKWAQRLASPLFFLLGVCLVVFGDAVSMGVFTGTITSIETRYGLTAADLGILVTAYSAGNMVALPFMAYFGGRRRASRPRWIASGTVVIAVGTIVNALPQFIFGKYDAVLSSDQIDSLTCTTDSDTDHCGSFDTVGTENSAAFWIMVCGSVVSGVGYAAIPTLSLSYIDDNCSTATTAMYAGIIESMYGIGSMIGFFICSFTLSFWVDFYRVDPDTVLPAQDHPAWVGAWWLGLIFCSLFFVLSCLPLLGFPRRLPARFKKECTAKAIDGRRTGLDEAHDPGEGQELREKDNADPICESGNEEEGPVKGLLKTYLRLLRNPIVMFITVGMACQMLLGYGFGTFFAKYLESQFEITSSLADLLTGVALVPSYGVGWVLGGFIVRKTRMEYTKMVFFALGSILLGVTIFIFLLFFGCGNPQIAGVNVGYQSQSLHEISLVADCNANCSCSSASYQPVCDEINDVIYFSPCHAGCNDTTGDRSYSNCSCLSTPSVTAVAGLCDFHCNRLAAFIGLEVLQTMAFTVAGVPQLLLVLRFVDPADKTAALGLNRLCQGLGGLVGPLIYAAIVDMSCLVWQAECGQYGACQVYDIELYRKLFMGVSLIIGALAATVLCPAYFFIRRTVRKRAEGASPRGDLYIILKDVKKVDDSEEP